MTDLHLDIDFSLGRREGLEAALRRAIRTGTLVAGTRVPSSRNLALALGVARATVVSAYEQLVAEGYLAAQHGSATRVASLPIAEVSATGAARPADTTRADFRPGEPDLTSFPRAAWASTARAVLREAPASMFAYGDAPGLPELRATLASYLGRSRAVVATPERVFVFSGFADACAALVRVIARSDHRPIAVEEPCLPWHRTAIEREAPVVGVRVDDEGLRADEVAASGAGALLVTPAHQYPLGVTLAAARRAALVEWARDSGAWIIEDDYDGEFRYNRQPVGALQGLAPDRVVYAGTASKSIAPGVGIGWLVVPAPLVEPLRELLHQRVATSIIEQAVLARFIDEGRLDRHLRRMRLVYRRRRQELLSVLHDAPGFAVHGIAAGLHVTARVESAARERELMEQATASSVSLFPLSYHYRTAQREPGFVFGFTRPPEHAWAGSLRRLRTVLTTGSVPAPALRPRPIP